MNWLVNLENWHQRNNMRILLIGLVLFLIGCTSTVKSPPKLLVIDWQKAFDHARAGHTVRLTIVDAATTDKSAFTVYLVDNRSVVYKHVVANLAFYVQDPCSFVVDLSPTLNRLDVPPSNETVIMLDGLKKSVNVSYKDMKVELVD